jgi:hypothetical protein
LGLGSADLTPEAQKNKLRDFSETTEVGDMGKRNV